MSITKDTTVCISIAERPSNFGTTLFNRAFAVLSLDWIYKACQVTSEELDAAILGLRALKIRGCGVSMPHKVAARQYLDSFDQTAVAVGAVNTIVNTDGHLQGFNTDVVGAERALSEKFDVTNKRVHILGAGGVARALIVAVKNLGAKEISLSNRHDEAGRALAREFGLLYHTSDNFRLPVADLLINATSVGMAADDDIIVSATALKAYEAVFDAVVRPTTRLTVTARELGLVTILGTRMSLYQAAHQFTLYTGVEAPLSEMEEALADLLSRT